MNEVVCDPDQMLRINDFVSLPAGYWHFTLAYLG